MKTVKNNNTTSYNVTENIGKRPLSALLYTRFCLRRKAIIITLQSRVKILGDSKNNKPYKSDWHTVYCTYTIKIPVHTSFFDLLSFIDAAPRFFYSPIFFTRDTCSWKSCSSYHQTLIDYFRKNLSIIRGNDF